MEQRTPDVILWECAQEAGRIIAEMQVVLGRVAGYGGIPSSEPPIRRIGALRTALKVLSVRASATSEMCSDAIRECERIIQELLKEPCAVKGCTRSNYNADGQPNYHNHPPTGLVDDAGCDSSGKYVGGPALPEGGNG